MPNKDCFKKTADILFLCLLPGAILSWGLFLPYIKSWEVGILELFAKNHLLYGLKVTCGLPVFNLIEGNPNYYYSHPPLVPLLISLLFKFFGVSEASARLVSVAFSVLAVCFFYLAIRSACGRRIALFSALFMCFMPMFSYYGRIVNYEAVTFGLCAVFLYGFIKFIHGGRRIFLAVTAIATVMGALSDWPFYLIFPALIFYARGKKDGLRLLAGMAALAMIVGAGFLVFMHQLGNLSLRAQLYPLLLRFQHKEFLGSIRFYQLLAGKIMTNFTPLTVALILIWLGRVFKERAFPHKEENTLAASLLIFGLSLPFLIPQAAYLHDWTLQYCIFGVALASGITAVKLEKTWQRIVISLFVVYSLVNLTIKHCFYRNYGAYEAGKAVARLAGPGDILYINEVSPVSFYAGIESRFFGGRGTLGAKEPPEEFIPKNLPDFVCIVSYALAPQYDYLKVSAVLEKEKYKKIYVKEGVFLWSRRR